VHLSLKAFSQKSNDQTASAGGGATTLGGGMPDTGCDLIYPVCVPSV